MSVMLATPAYAKFSGQYVVGLMGSIGVYKGWLPHYGQADIYVCRNALVNTFMAQPQFDTLVMVDSDIGFTKENLQDLIASPAPFVSGLYPTRGTNPEWLFRELSGEKPKPEDIPERGLREVKWIATGFVKIARSALETLIESKQIAPYGGGRCHQFFQGVISDDYLLSEDYSFAELMRRAGVKSYVNCAISLEHEGSKLR